MLHLQPLAVAADVLGGLAVLALGLNVQWGYTGQINIGVAGFFAVGAYTSAILTTAPNPDQLEAFLGVDPTDVDAVESIVNVVAAGAALVGLLVYVPHLHALLFG